MKKTYILSALVAMALSSGMTSCSDVDIPDTPAASKVENLTSEVDGRTVTLNWTLPQDETITGIQILRNGTVIETLEGPQITCTLRKETPDNDVTYTVKIIYEDGRVSEGQTVHLDVVSNEKIAMLLPCPQAELTDDDEIATAKWFAEAYAEDGEMLTPDKVSVLDPDKYPVVWINIDREGLQIGWRNLPAEIVSDATIEALRSYVDAGGNVFLTKHATQLTVPLGFLDEKFAPGIFASGPGGEGGDIWSINCNIGLIYDHNDSELFRGLTTCDVFQYPTFPLIGPGWREDHNCMWDLNAYQYTAEGENTVEKFQNENHCTVMATWGQVVDFAVGGMLDFESVNGRGRCVANGLAAYEFYQPGGNQYQANVERLSRNCLDYLNK